MPPAASLLATWLTAILLPCLQWTTDAHVTALAAFYEEDFGAPNMLRESPLAASVATCRAVEGVLLQHASLFAPFSLGARLRGQVLLGMSSADHQPARSSEPTLRPERLPSCGAHNLCAVDERKQLLSAFIRES